MIALDTNLLIYAHRSKTPQHQAAKRAIQNACSANRGWGISLPCIAEFWAVATHPSALGGPSTGADALRFVDSMIDAGAQIWVPGPGFQRRLFQTAVDLEVQGARVFDLQIALVAFDNGASEIWTHDAHFVSVPGLKVQDPILAN